MSLLALLLASIGVTAFAVEGGDYQTPDTWKQHYSLSGVKYNTDGASVAGGDLDATISSRTSIRSFDDSLVEEYLYLRLKLANIDLAGGNVGANLYFRGGFSGEEFEPGPFNSTKNAFYVERNDETIALRLYQANVVLDDLIPQTAVTLGRFYLNHIDTQLVDGADVTVHLLDDMLGIYALYGMPVSFYTKSPSTTLFGGGVDLKPIDILRIRAEYLSYSYDDGDYDFQNGILKARADAKVLDVVSVYLNYKVIDSVSDAELGAIVDLPPIAEPLGGTTVFASARIISDYYDEETSQFVDPFGTGLGQEGKNTLLSAELYQGLLEWLAISVGVQGKLISGDPSYAHREFSHVYGAVDFNGLFDPNLFIQINGGSWLAPADKSLKEESTFQIGGQVSYRLSAIDLWLGTNFQKYAYYFANELNPQSALTRGRLTKYFEQDARSFYLGGQYNLENIGLTVGADLSFTSSSVYSAYNDDFNDTFDTRVEITLNWTL
jgi:hypothetical protein